MTAANALAGGWTAVWRVANTAGKKFNAKSAIPATAVTATCGSTTLTGGTLTYDTNHLFVKY
jgi:hypothetical protein